MSRVGAGWSFELFVQQTIGKGCKTEILFSEGSLGFMNFVPG
jgi:hypothetical protein